MSCPLPETRTLPALLENSVTRYADRPSLGYAGDDAMTYKELADKVSHVASYLQDNGVEPGDRVAILSENGPNWGVAFFAVTSIKAVAVPILNDFHSTEIHHILRHSGASVLFVSERLFHKVEEFELNHFSAVILIDNLSVISPDWSKERLKKLYAQGSRELRRIKHMALQKAGLMTMNVEEEDPASIIYTSGTTGHSKGVVLTHGNIVSNAISLEQVVSVDYTERLLSILPLPHVYECTVGLIMPLMIGASVYYVTRPPTAAVLLPALEQVRPTVMLSVPLIIEKMYKGRILPEIRKKKLVGNLYKIPAVRRLIHRQAGKKLMKIFGGCIKIFPIGGAPVAPEVELFLKEARFPYAIGYGLTETSPMVTANYGDTRLYSVGKPMPGIEVRIDYSRNWSPEGVTQNETTPDDNTGQMKESLQHTVQDSGDGEILVRGPNIMKEYYKDPELTSSVMTDDGWLRTGDLGAFDKDGYLYIRGRLKNVILGPSGENIYPEGIESVLHRSDYVLESVVYKKNGSLVARVHLNYEKLDEELSAKGLSESQIREYIKKLLVSIRDEANANVAAYSRLAEVIEQTEPFEKTPTQKIKRYLYVSEP